MIRKIQLCIKQYSQVFNASNFMYIMSILFIFRRMLWSVLVPMKGYTVRTVAYWYDIYTVWTVKAFRVFHREYIKGCIKFW